MDNCTVMSKIKKVKKPTQQGKKKKPTKEELALVGALQKEHQKMKPRKSEQGELFPKVKREKGSNKNTYYWRNREVVLKKRAKFKAENPEKVKQWYKTYKEKKKLKPISAEEKREKELKGKRAWYKKRKKDILRYQRKHRIDKKQKKQEEFIKKFAEKHG